MKADTPYIHLHQRKRTWTPVAVDAGQLLVGGEDVIKRALALRCLEIPVGDFINETMRGDLPEDRGCKKLLQSNVIDEEKHDIALNYAAQAHNIPDAFEQELKKLKTLGWNLTVTLFSKLWFLREASSSCCCQSSDSWAIQGCVQQVPTSS